MKTSFRFVLLGCVLFLLVLKIGTESSSLNAIKEQFASSTVDFGVHSSLSLPEPVDYHRETKDKASNDEVLATDVSVIITSSLIPMHPDISFINRTIASLGFLQGLPVSTPIFVTVDGLPPRQAAIPKNRDRLAQYIQNLSEASFPPYTNVNILASPTHLHLAGSVNMALKHVPTRFLYVLQHDLVFSRTIDHTKLIRAMVDHPRQLRNVRFRLHAGSFGAKLGSWPICNGQQEDWTLGGLAFFPTATWSDNNQLTTKAYYEEMMSFMGNLQRPMEFAMQSTAGRNCTAWGQVLFGGRYDKKGICIRHLDGKRSGRKGSNALSNETVSAGPTSNGSNPSPTGISSTLDGSHHTGAAYLDSPGVQRTASSVELNRSQLEPESVLPLSAAAGGVSDFL